MLSTAVDVVVVGGGPAGLSAALMLGRARRKVLVVDAGRYRNDASRAVHGFLTRDGVAPAELRHLARMELQRYMVRHVYDEVRRIEAKGDRFRLQLAANGEVVAGKVVLATGVVDNLPDLPGLPALFGRSVFLCPYCDAWEVRGRPLGVHGRGGADLAVLLRSWSNDVVCFADEPLSEAEQAKLAAAGVAVSVGPVARLEGEQGRLAQVVLEDGRAVPREALFLKLSGRRQRSNLAEQLGLEVTEAAGVVHGERGATSVRGVFVAGDATRDLLFSIVAASEGAAAGVAAHEELRADELRGARAVMHR